MPALKSWSFNFDASWHWEVVDHNEPETAAIFHSPPLLRILVQMPGKIYWKLFFALMLSGAVHAQSLLLWQGFEHRWTQPQRVGRLADYIISPECDKSICYAEWVHSGYTHGRQDTGLFNLHAIWIKKQEMTTDAGSEQFKIRGNEHELITDSVDIVVKQFRDGGEIFLNGFDLEAREPEKSDRFEEFSISLSDWSYSSDGKIRVKLKYRLKMGCTDCPDADGIVDYKLRIFWVAIFPECNTDRFPNEITETKSWKTGEPQITGLGRREINRNAPPRPTFGGIKGFEFQLNRDFPFQFIGMHRNVWEVSTMDYANFYPWMDFPEMKISKPDPVGTEFSQKFLQNIPGNAFFRIKSTEIYCDGIWSEPEQYIRTVSYPEAEKTKWSKPGEIEQQVKGTFFINSR